jgi:hypothetical protein
MNGNVVSVTVNAADTTSVPVINVTVRGPTCALGAIAIGTVAKVGELTVGSASTVIPEPNVT